MSKSGLPRRVYLKHGRYWYVAPADGKWHGLTREREGLPAMLRALATLTDQAATSDRMPGVITRWLDSKVASGEWEESTRRNMERIAAYMAKRFRTAWPREFTPPHCAAYLKEFLDRPRTYNVHRSVLRQVLSFAALEGLREGHNPIDDVPQRKLKRRQRIVTDAEIAAIKRALMGTKRGGEAHCLMIDLAMLTGQRISDVLRMRWQDVTDEGVLVDQGKTDAKLLIEWTPALRAAVAACAKSRERIGHLLVQSTGKPYRYAGVRSAWVRACAKAGVEDLHIHDMRGRAGADIADEFGPYAAQMLLGHESVTMTEGYIRGKTRRRATAVQPRKAV